MRKVALIVIGVLFAGPVSSFGAVSVRVDGWSYTYTDYEPAPPWVSLEMLAQATTGCTASANKVQISATAFAYSNSLYDPEFLPPQPGIALATCGVICVIWLEADTFEALPTHYRIVDRLTITHTCTADAWCDVDLTGTGYAEAGKRRLTPCSSPTGISITAHVPNDSTGCEEYGDESQTFVVTWNQNTMEALHGQSTPNREKQ